jgi:hypothetical protein
MIDAMIFAAIPREGRVLRFSPIGG